MSNPINRLDYCQYLRVSQINYTLTYFADHSEQWSHAPVNRYLKREQFTPRLIGENVESQVDADAYGDVLFDDTVLDKRHSFATGVSLNKPAAKSLSLEAFPKNTR